MGKPYNEFLVLQSAVAATGNGNDMDVSGYSAVAVQVSGTFVATVTFYGSVDDGSNFIACQGISYNDGSISTTATAAGMWYIPVAGFSLFRAAVTWSSGTSVTVKARAVSGVGAVPSDVTLGASEAVLGQVVGSSKTFTITGATVAVDADTYASGDCLGAKLTLTDAGRVNSGNVYLQSIVVQDLTAQSAAMDLYIFNANPSGTTFTDAATLTIADADLPKVAAIVPIAASDYHATTGSSVAQPEFNPRLITCDASADLYAILVCRGTPTYAANELSLILGFMRD